MINNLNKTDELEDMVPTKSQVTFKRAKHPIFLRLRDSSGISVTSPLSLISAGYASLTMGLCTLFRPTPVLFYTLLIRFYKYSTEFTIDQLLMFFFLFTWSGLVVFVLLVLGIVLAASEKITKRWILLLHPWGLLLLYLDVFIWVPVVVWLHMDVTRCSEVSHKVFTPSHTPIEFFIFMYVECFVMWLLYYVYATYFIAAELTVIEKFF